MKGKILVKKRIFYKFVGWEKDDEIDLENHWNLLRIHKNVRGFLWNKWKKLFNGIFLETNSSWNKTNSFSWRKISLYMIESGHIWSKTCIDGKKANFSKQRISHKNFLMKVFYLCKEILEEKKNLNLKMKKT